MTDENKLSKRDKSHLNRVANEFLKAIHEEVSNCLLLEDVDRLGLLVSQVDIILGFEVIKTLKDKGFSKEITELCDKAGKL